MKLTHGKKKSDRTVASILVPGLIVLTVSIIVCMLHVTDVRDSFEEEMIQDTFDELLGMTNKAQDTMERTLEILEQAAVIWEKAIEAGYKDENELIAALSESKSLKIFYKLLYIEEGKVYGADGLDPDMLQGEFADYVQTGQSAIYMCSTDILPQGGGICYIVPVRGDGETKGCLVGLLEADQLLTGNAYLNLAAKSDVFLIGRDGRIYAQDAQRFTEMSEKEMQEGVPNLFERMRSVAADSRSGAEIGRTSSNLLRSNYTRISIVDTDGMTDYLELRRIGEMENAYFVCVYPETLYTDVLRPVVFRSLLTCIVIVCVMIFMLVYVWMTLKQANEKIYSLAYDDPITGGRNDNYFREMASRAIWENDTIPYLVARFDVVNFRYINEAYGHMRADRLLRIIGEESAKVFYGNEICSRINADQFVLLAKNDKEYEKKCENMTAAINERARVVGIKFPIRFKWGVYQMRKGDKNIGIIIDRANAARKTLSGDEKVLTVIYSDKILGRLYKNEQIESEMEAAMRNGEFKVYIQPKWDIVHDRVCGGEALVRWIKEDGSMVYPDEFIPVFEKNGFIEKLDMFMLEEVCKQQRHLIDENRLIYPISVNQSRVLMHNPEYVNQVAKILKRYRIPNGYIELEVTETVFLDQRKLMITTMNQLKKMEVQLSMDDFGSGYSSLNMLKDIPFDVMKIDRGFFSESTTSSSSILILRKIIEMAEGLGIRVLCEGVETKEQVDLLRELGCYYVQGYYYSKPIPAQEYVQKYCRDTEDGKSYYEALYQKERTAREERSLREEEAVYGRSAKSAVEFFKKVYVAPATDKSRRREKTAPDGKIISSEAQKVLVQMAKEKKNGHKK